MKKVLALALVVMVASAMILSAQAKVTIKLGIWPEDSREAEVKLNQDFKAQFEAANPNVTVVPAFYHYSADTFLPLAASGQLPTVFDTWFTEPSKIIGAGYAADLTAVLKKTGYDKIMNPAVKALLTKNGKIYGIPRDGYALGLYLNMNLFKKAGLIDKNGLPMYPKTMDELAKTAQIIKQKTGKAGMYIASKDNVGGWHFTNLAWNFGAQFEVLKNGKWMANLNSPEVIKALQFVKDLKWKYDVLLPSTMLGWSEWIQNFGTDQVGMVFAAPDVLNAPVNDYQMSKDAIAIVPIPKGPTGKQFSLLGGTLYMFSNKASQAEIEAGLKWIETIGKLPVVTKTNIDGISKDLKDRGAAGQPIGPRSLQMWNNPEFEAAVAKAYAENTNVDMRLFQEYYKVSQFNVKPEEPWNTQDLYRTLDGVIQNVLNNKNANPAALLAAANAQFQKDYMDKVK